jgi:hypothetical protein
MTGSMAGKSPAATAPSDSSAAVLVCVAAWALPGAGHLWLGRRQKGVVFLAALLAMFLLGLWLEGRIFPLEPSEPLVALAAIANFGVGVPWLLARMFDLGSGTVTAVTYEYGNSFLIVAGLLNFLVILDAYDIAAGRK